MHDRREALVLWGLMLALGACDAGPPRAVPTGDPPRPLSDVVEAPATPLVRTSDSAWTRDGLEYRATTMIRSSTEQLQRIQARVTLHNRSTDRVVVPIQGCPVLLNLYSRPERTGRPVWSQGGDAGWSCLERGFQVLLRPGESRTFVSEPVPVHALLLDSVRPGPIYATATVRHPGEAVELTAGRPVLGSQLHGLELAARWDASPDSSSSAGVVVEATVTNLRSGTAYLELPGCVISLALYPGRRREGPGWAWRPRDQERTCPPTVLRRRSLRPGESAVLERLRIPARRILGDSLAPGEYRAEATLRVNYFETGPIALGSGPVPSP